MEKYKKFVNLKFEFVNVSKLLIINCITNYLFYVNKNYFSIKIKKAL